MPAFVHVGPSHSHSRRSVTTSSTLHAGGASIVATLLRSAPALVASRVLLRIASHIATTTTTAASTVALLHWGVIGVVYTALWHVVALILHHRWVAVVASALRLAVALWGTPTTRLKRVGKGVQFPIVRHFSLFSLLPWLVKRT